MEGLERVWIYTQLFFIWMVYPCVVHGEGVADRSRRNAEITALMDERCKDFSERTDYCAELLEHLTDTLSTDKSFNSADFREGGTRPDPEQKWLCMDYNPLKFTFYNVATQLCCNGLHNKTTGREECCHGRVIDSQDNFCCNREVSSEGVQGCCGNFNYYVDKELCCLDKLHTKTNELTKCCGENAYQENTHLCCDRVVREQVNGGDNPESVAPKQIYVIVVAVLVVLCKLRLRIKKRSNKGMGVNVNNLDQQTLRYPTTPNPYTDAFSTFIQSSSYSSHNLDRPLNVAEIRSENDSDYKTTLISFDLLEKHTLNNKGNLLTDHYMDSSTQTEVGSETNRRTIFGKRFEHRFLVDQSRATVEMPDSNVRMTLPVKELISHPIEVFCSSFDNIAAIRKKLGVSENLDIASPTVEYALTGNPALCDVAVIVLPFVGSEESLKVWKFKSDEGIRQVPETVEVPKKGKQNEQLDLFYIVQDRHVFIYTRSFSGFYCTVDRHREIRLRAFLFGSYKRIMPNDNSQPRMEVRIALYIADEILKYDDYKKRLLGMEDIEGRILKKEIRLEAPETSRDRPLEHDDAVEACLDSTDTDPVWIPATMPNSTEPIFPRLKTIKLSEIVQKCPDCPFSHFTFEDLEMPTGKEWYLRARPGTLPGFNYSGVVSIALCSKSGGRAVKKVVIDELGLRQEDRYPVQAEIYVRSVHGIKEYLAGHPGEDVQKVLRHIGERYKVDSSSVPDTFAQLWVRLMPVAIIEAVVEALRATGQFGVIDALQKVGYIPGSLMYTPTQAVDTTNPAPMAARFVVPECGPSMLENQVTFTASQYRCVSGGCENEARSEVETLPLLAAPVRESETGDTQALRREINFSPVCSYDIENEKEPLVQNTCDIVHGELETSISAEITSESHPPCPGTSGRQGHGRMLENTHPKELSIIAEETEPPESFRQSENDLSDDGN
ncbi:GXN-like protein [Mya arenaria]|uniref:GXN-like protein n=1 Tax=Mya arenaria TaxID=6604 RepID=A0ABY7EL54_MYAAR|nr:GXN-like protein [Mya arenaria]